VHAVATEGAPLGAVDIGDLPSKTLAGSWLRLRFGVCFRPRFHLFIGEDIWSIAFSHMYLSFQYLIYMYRYKYSIYHASKLDNGPLALQHSSK
jgi:hypothetical protein